jgi:low temperature requirement protein LtrA
MLASLVMSVAIPEAFGERGLMFALAYVAIQVGCTVFVVIVLNKSLGRSDPLSRNFQRIFFWLLASGVLWLIGGLLEGEARYVLWALALAVEYISPVVGFYTPSLGRSTTETWRTVEGGHAAYDNALAETFVAPLKTELLYRASWPTRQTATRKEAYLGDDRREGRGRNAIVR